MHRLCKKIPEAMTLLKPLQIFGRPERMPNNIQSGDSVVCEYCNDLILCDDLKEMRELFAAHSHGATKSIAWHFVSYRDLPRLAQMGQQKRKEKKRW